MNHVTSVTFGRSYAAVEVAEIQAAAGMSTMFHSSVAHTQRERQCGGDELCLHSECLQWWKEKMLLGRWMHNDKTDTCKCIVDQTFSLLARAALGDASACSVVLLDPHSSQISSVACLPEAFYSPL